MSDPAILSALKKRQELEERIAKTERRIKTFKSQITEINSFISTWEKFSGRPAPKLMLANPSQNETDSGNELDLTNSSKEDVAAEAREILEKYNEPMSRSELYKKLTSRGLRITGKNPEMVLSTMLWRAGKDVGIVRLKTGGYFLAERTNPIDHEEENSSGL